MQRQEGDQRAQGERPAFQGDDGAGDRQQDVAKVADVAVDRHDDVADPVGVVDAGTQRLVEDGELLARLPLVAVDLDDPLPGHHLLDETVHLAQVFLAGGKVLLRQFAQPRRHEERQGGQQEGDTGQGQRKDDHGRQGGDNGDQRLEQARQRIADGLPERVHIVGVDRHDGPVRVGIEVAQRQGFHVGEEVVTELLHRSLPHVDHDQVVGVRRGHPRQEHGPQFHEHAQQRCVVVGRRPEHGRNVVVDQRTREQGRGKRRQGGDDDTDHDESQAKLVLLPDQAEKAPHGGAAPEALLQVFPGEAGAARTTVPHLHTRCIAHLIASFSSKSPSAPEVCIS